MKSLLSLVVFMASVVSMADVHQYQKLTCMDFEKKFDQVNKTISMRPLNEQQITTYFQSLPSGKSLLSEIKKSYVGELRLASQNVRKVDRYYVKEVVGMAIPNSMGYEITLETDPVNTEVDDVQQYLDQKFSAKFKVLLQNFNGQKVLTILTVDFSDYQKEYSCLSL